MKSKINRCVPSSKSKSRPFTEEDLNTGIKSLKNGKAIGLDNISVEEIKHFGLKARKWLLQFFNNCLFQQKIPRIWRRTKVVAQLKPGKNCSKSKSYRPIFLLSHLYKRLERLLLNRIAPIIETHLIEEQAGFRPGKSTIGQLLNLTQHIEDGYQKKKIAGAVFVDLSAAHDTVNHRLLLQKILKMTDYLHLVQFVGKMLRNRRFFVMLNNKRSRVRLQKNGLLQGSVLLYNIYTDDQPLDPETKRFVYADNLCVTSQHSTFTAVKKLLTNALNGLQVYYAKHSLKANPSKTQVCCFHLKNREANRPLNIIWHGKKLESTAYPKYLGVTFDRPRIFKMHIQNCKAKVCTRNNILRKLISSHWRASPHTLRISALALCYSAAEYAYSVWSRSAHAHRLDPALNGSCRIITGCLKSTNTNCLYLLAGIAPPDIRREVASRRERKKGRHDQSYMLYGLEAANQRLKSRKSFLHTTCKVLSLTFSLFSFAVLVFHAAT